MAALQLWTAVTNAPSSVCSAGRLCVRLSFALKAKLSRKEVRPPVRHFNHFPAVQPLYDADTNFIRDSDIL